MRNFFIILAVWLLAFACVFGIIRIANEISAPATPADDWTVKNFR